MARKSKTRPSSQTLRRRNRPESEPRKPPTTVPRSRQRSFAMNANMLNTMRERSVGDLRAAADAIEQACENGDHEAIRSALSQATLGVRTGKELANAYRRAERQRERQAQRQAQREAAQASS